MYGAYRHPPAFSPPNPFTTVNSQFNKADLPWRRQQLQPLQPPHRDPVLVAFGDSFVGPFQLISRIGSKHLQFRRWGGATARGLHNTQSTLQVGVQVLQHIASLPPRSTVLLVFGNVDLQITPIYHMQKTGMRIPVPEAWAEKVWDDFKVWLEGPFTDACKKAQVASVCIGSVIHPTIQDEFIVDVSDKYTNSRGEGDQAVRKADWTEVLQKLEAAGQTDLKAPTTTVEAMKLILRIPNSPSSLEHRRDLHRHYQTLVTSGCITLSSPDLPFHYIDVNSHISDPITMEIDARYNTGDPRNVHINWEATLRFWLDELESKAGLTNLRPLMEQLDLSGIAKEYATRVANKVPPPRGAGDPQRPRAPRTLAQRYWAHDVIRTYTRPRPQHPHPYAK